MSGFIHGRLAARCKKRDHMNNGNQPRSSQVIVYILFAILALLLVGLQATHMFKLAYHANEDWSVFWSSTRTANGLQLKHVLTTDNLALDVWISLFGNAAPITRYLSALLNVTCFAFVFRLGTDLFNRKTAFTAVLLLATVSVIHNSSGLAQPFAALLMLVPALLWMGLRWLRRPNRKTAGLYVGLGLVAAYVCIFSLLIIAAQALFFLLFVPRNRQRDRRSLLIFIIIAAAALPRLIAFTTINLQSGLPFASGYAVDLLNIPISILPLELAQLILLMALAITAVSLESGADTIAKCRLEKSANWHVVYLVSIAVLFVLMLVLFSNLTIGSIYIIAVIPIMALLAARGIESLSRPSRGLILIVFVLPSLAGFRDMLPLMPYQDIVDKTVLSPNTNSKLIVAAPYVWQHLPLTHYAAQESDRIFHLLSNQADDSSSFMPQEQTAYLSDAISVQRFNQFVGDAPEIWLYTENLADKQLADFSNTLLKTYDELSPTQLRPDERQMTSYSELRKFVRIPANLQPMFVFGDVLSLRAWQLKDSVNVAPCQTITVQSWWGTDKPIGDNLSMTLVLTNPANGQGIANADGIPTGRDISTLPLNQPHVDERSIQIPCDIQTGSYPLLIGIYKFTDDGLSQLAVTASDGAPLGHFAYLTTLFVNP